MSVEKSAKKPTGRPKGARDKKPRKRPVRRQPPAHGAAGVAGAVAGAPAAVAAPKPEPVPDGDAGADAARERLERNVQEKLAVVEKALDVPAGKLMSREGMERMMQRVVVPRGLAAVARFATPKGHQVIPPTEDEIKTIEPAATELVLIYAPQLDGKTFAWICFGIAMLDFVEVRRAAPKAEPASAAAPSQSEAKAA